MAIPPFTAERLIAWSGAHPAVVGAGCAILLVITWIAVRRFLPDPRLRFRVDTVPAFFTRAELDFFSVLRPVAAELDLVVFAKVGLKDLFRGARRGPRGQFGRYSQMHVDFLLVTDRDFRPVLGIEVDGWDLERARQDLYRVEQEYNDARYDYDRAERRVSELEREAAGYRAAMNAARDQMNRARDAIEQDRATIRDNDAVLGIGPSIQGAADRLLANGAAVRTHADYVAKRPEFQGDVQQLATHAANETYRRVHGSALQERLAPVQALLTSMDKPAAGR